MDPNAIGIYKKTLDDNIFACIEMTKLSYHSIMMMPVKRFFDHMKWKADLEEARMKLIDEQRGKK